SQIPKEKSMTIRALSSLALLVFAIAPIAGQDKKELAKETGSSARFDQFKKLAGEWVSTEKGKDGHDIQVKYKVTAGGSAVVETIFPGSEHEMVTVIHPDGEDLILTHYCALGNQPKMRAKTKGDDKKVAFEFTGATNMKSDKDMHMHNVTFTFVDKDTLKADWTHYVDGKDGGVVTFELKRKK
ncbi:MAG TPA: hypothetical protein VGZ25_01735, partial [Gemmataceae bacterium]|nr:hypothetical protein [Gemmataceae bacterium]